MSFISYYVIVIFGLKIMIYHKHVIGILGILDGMLILSMYNVTLFISIFYILLG